MLSILVLLYSFLGMLRWAGTKRLIGKEQRGNAVRKGNITEIDHAKLCNM